MPFELLHSPCGPSHLSQELSRLTLGHPTHYGCTNIVHLSVCSAILGWRRGHRRNHRFGPAKTLTIRSSSGQFCRIERGVACSPIQALLHFDRHLELGGVTYKPLLDVKRTDDRRLPLDGILGEADGVLRVLFLRETYSFCFCAICFVFGGRLLTDAEISDAGRVQGWTIPPRSCAGAFPGCSSGPGASAAISCWHSRRRDI